MFVCDTCALHGHVDDISASQVHCLMSETLYVDIYANMYIHVFSTLTGFPVSLHSVNFSNTCSS